MKCILYLHRTCRDETGHEKFHTGDVLYRDPCSVSDWLFLDFLFSRANNNQSETPSGSLWSYVISMEFFRSNLCGLSSGKGIERAKNAVDFSAFFLSQFTCRYRNVGEELQDPLLTERYCKENYIKY